MKTVLLALLAGCATSGSRLEPTLVKAASTYEGVREIELRVDASGAVRKMSVQHGSALKVPDAVRKLFEEKLPGARILRYELELHDGVWYHEIEGETAEKRECELSASEGGQFRYLECALPPDALPEPVKKALETLLPGAEVVEVETVKGPAVDQVSVEAKVGGRVHALAFSPAGALIAHHIHVPAVVEVPAE